MFFLKKDLYGGTDENKYAACSNITALRSADCTEGGSKMQNMFFAVTDTSKAKNNKMIRDTQIILRVKVQSK